MDLDYLGALFNLIDREQLLLPRISNGFVSSCLVDDALPAEAALLRLEEDGGKVCTPLRCCRRRLPGPSAASSFFFFPSAHQVHGPTPGEGGSIFCCFLFSYGFPYVQYILWFLNIDLSHVMFFTSWGILSHEKLFTYMFIKCQRIVK